MTFKIEKTNYIRVKAIPKSPKMEIKGILVDSDGEKTYKIAVKAAPERGKANAELTRFLSEELGVKKDRISIISGAKDKVKLIRISNGTDK